MTRPSEGERGRRDSLGYDDVIGWLFGVGGPATDAEVNAEPLPCVRCGRRPVFEQTRAAWFRASRSVTGWWALVCAGPWWRFLSTCSQGPEAFVDCKDDLRWIRKGAAVRWNRWQRDRLTALDRGRGGDGG